MTKVKICGITNLEDALLSAKFGADALGFNFYEKSPRYILPEVAREIIIELPEDVLKVGVFVNEDLNKIIEIANVATLDAIQLHGEETHEFARELKKKTGLEIIKAFRVSKDFKPEDVLQYEVDAVLLDAYSPNEHGGTGETFDWEIAKKVKEIFPKMYLAGGISQEIVSKAILNVEPFSIDTCSGVEERKGVKSKVKIVNFLSIVNFTNNEFSKVGNVNDLFYLLSLYQKRPKLYLPEKSLTHLCSFIIGYLSALNHKSSKFIEIDNFFKSFDKYLGIHKRMFVHHYYTYSSHFLEQSNDNEQDAFDLFYAKLEEFKLEHEDL